MTLPAGTILGNRYRIERLLGQGGMGTVYVATQLDLGRRVALKVLDEKLTFSTDHIARFRREAETTAQLGHPNIVSVTDFNAQPPYLVMELLEGESLAQRIERKGALDFGEVARITSQILDALAAAHRAGIVHRDIKPDNIFLVPISGVGDVVKVLDFGVAKLVGNSSVTSTGAVIGTLAYMAPEQAQGFEIDGRADLYAVGATMYHALAGRLPFDGDSAAQVLLSIMQRPPPPLAHARPDAPPFMLAMIECAMAKDVAARFRSADAMRAALDQTAGSQPPSHPSRVVVVSSPAPTSPIAQTVAQSIPGTSAPVVVTPPPPMPYASVPRKEKSGLGFWGCGAIVGGIGVLAIAGVFVVAIALKSREKGSSNEPTPIASPSAPAGDIDAGAPTMTASAAPSQTTVATTVAGRTTPIATARVDASTLTAATTPATTTSNREDFTTMMCGDVANTSGYNFGDCPGCDNADVKALFASVKPDVNQCFKSTQSVAPVHESVAFEITINDNGTVRTVDRADTPICPPFDACVVAALRKMTFKLTKPVRGSGRVTFGAECVRGWAGRCGQPAPK